MLKSLIEPSLFNFSDSWEVGEIDIDSSCASCHVEHTVTKLHSLRTPNHVLKAKLELLTKAMNMRN